ncbi:hypothetical protein ACVOMV_04885 [Mesorhizobium atlanticum]
MSRSEGPAGRASRDTPTRSRSSFGRTARRLCGPDRLLAGELGLSRSRLQYLDDRRRLTIEPDGAKALPQAGSGRAWVRIDLTKEADCRAILSAACR